MRVPSLLDPSRMPGPRRPGRTPRALVGGPWPLLLLAACASSPRVEGGTAADFGRLVEAAGAVPVEASAVDEPLDATPDDPLGVDQEGAQELVGQAEPEIADVPENPYIRFGERIVIHTGADGRDLITKPFPMPPGKAARIVDLIRALAPFPLRGRPPLTGGEDAGDPPPGTVDYLVLENWDQEYYADLAAKVPTQASPVNLSDVLVITAEADLLAEFEAFLDLFSAGIPQIELEAKVIEIVEDDRFDLGVDLDFDLGNGGTAATFVKSLAIGLPNSAEAAEAVLTLGAIQDGVAFDAVIEAVRNWQNVTIETRPKTVVRAGGLARLESTVDIPYFDVKTLSDTGAFTSGVQYKSTGVKLYITPRVVGSQALALDVQLENSQVVSFQTVFSQAATNPGQPDTVISVPVIANRTARTIVYLEPGQTLLIGGLTQESNQESVRKVPILGDLPIVGLLFRSTLTVKRREHVIFAISPRIIQRNDLRAVL